MPRNSLSGLRVQRSTLKSLTENQDSVRLAEAESIIVASIEGNSKKGMDDMDSLSRFGSGFKRVGTRNVNNKVFEFWQQDNPPIELSTNGMIDQRLDYLHENPVPGRNFCEAGHYMYSLPSIICREGRDALPIELL